ncbi:MAG: hypothetical protein K9L79_01575 [Methylobacter tundripaludum]|nr:hypothetical protein [Methylobacter tundripaludum]
MNRKNTQQSDFKGFGDFIELFESGTRTDSAGRTGVWTNNDIDQVIANHSAADAAPIVIGHPASDASSFAYGWADQLKREGNKLLGKFKQVDPVFEQWAKEGKVKNRSVRFVRGQNGLRLAHVGFLGATPPAITGLKPIEFSSADEVFDFSMAEWQSTGIIARCMRNLRELFIEKYGQEQTDKVLSSYDIDELNRLSEQQYQEEQAEQQAEADSTGLPSSFSQPQDTAMAEPTQAELDAEKSRASAAEQQAADFAAQNKTLEQQLATERAERKRVEFQSIIDGHKKRGVAPAVLEGAADFMLQLDDGETGVFEFSVGDDNAKKSFKQVDFVKNLLNALPVAVKPGSVDFSGDVKSGGTVEDITKAAQSYQFSESQAGRTISAADAVAFVTKGVSHE